MRKFFTFLCAALMSVGMWAEPVTVTWNNEDISGSGNSFTKDGVTLTCGMNIDWDDKTFLDGGTFTTNLGNFTKIVVTAGDCGISGEGWSGSSAQKTWTGNAASVSYSGEIMGMADGVTFVFTIGSAAPAAKYYIVGTMNSWGVDENYEMNPSLEAETEEYFYTLDLTTTSEFKVVKVQNGQQSWIPEGMGNNYGQHGEITENGEYTVYFRPKADGGEGWFYNCIYVEKTGEFVPEEPTYYLIGNMTGWDVDENYELNPNIDSDIEEYFYVLDLTTTSQFKVVKVQNGQQSWFPEGMGNSYGENGEITEDGEYTVYFRPNYNGGEDWFYNCLYVSKNEEKPELEPDPTVMFIAFPTENCPENIEIAGVNREFTWVMVALDNKPWYVSKEHLNTYATDSIKFRDAANNAMILCEYIPANGGQEGRWQQLYLVMGDYPMDSYKLDIVRYIDDLNLSNASNYAWMENAPEPLPTGFENIVLTEKAQKVIVDGMIYIVRDGKFFNLQGAQVK